VVNVTSGVNLEGAWGTRSLRFVHPPDAKTTATASPAIIFLFLVFIYNYLLMLLKN
jgi:hypothetical protein